MKSMVMVCQALGHTGRGWSKPDDFTHLFPVARFGRSVQSGAHLGASETTKTSYTLFGMWLPPRNGLQLHCYVAHARLHHVLPGDCPTMFLSDGGSLLEPKYCLRRLGCATTIPATSFVPLDLSRILLQLSQANVVEQQWRCAVAPLARVVTMRQQPHL